MIIMLYKTFYHILKIKSYESLNFLALIFLGIFTICNTLTLDAQENINLTQYVTGISAINPAYSGVNGRFTAQFISHNQWVGIEGAPTTNALLINTAVSGYKLGLGATIVNEKLGSSNTFALSINTAYHTKLTDDIRLSYGLKSMLGYYQQSYIGDQLTDPGDPYFQDVPKGSVYLNFGAGVYLSSDKFAISYSVSPLLKNKLKSNFEEDIDFYEINNIMNHYLMGTYVFTINPKVILKPSVLLRSNNALKTTVDVSLATIYNQQFWFGLTYQSSKRMSVFTQLQIGNKLRVGYAFDFGISQEYSLNSAGSHELICTVDIQLKKKKYITPRYM